MRELIQQYLSSMPSTYWESDEDAIILFDSLAHDPFGIGEHPDYSINELKHKPVLLMSRREIEVLLTVLARKEHERNRFSSAIDSGRLEELLRRYLELTEPEE